MPCDSGVTTVHSAPGTPAAASAAGAVSGAVAVASLVPGDVDPVADGSSSDEHAAPASTAATAPTAASRRQVLGRSPPHAMGRP